MSDNKFVLFFAILLSFVIISMPSYAKKIKGDPDLIWLSPLGDSDIENNAYNRCRLIKKIKPGNEKASETTKNNFDILSSYASNLYAQSLKMAGYIESEQGESSSSEADLSSKTGITDVEVTQRIGYIAHRMNIINSLEAGIMLLESLSIMADQAPTTYSDFRVLKNGTFEYSSDCNDLK